MYYFSTTIVNDTTIANMTLGQAKELFLEMQNTLSEQYGEYSVEYLRFVEAFWNSIARIRSNADKKSMQKILKDLELHKRRLGKQYSKSKNPFLASKYNEIEDDIRYLCKQFGLKRSTKPYYFKDIM